MISTEYANAYSEVLEILKYIPDEDYKKIPKDKINLFKTNANTNYIFPYNPNKTLDEQNVSKITKGIIAILFRDYWATEIQREKIIAIQMHNKQKLEESKREKYDPDKLFNNNIYSETNKEQALMKIEKEKWYDKIIKFFRKIKNDIFN